MITSILWFILFAFGSTLVVLFLTRPVKYIFDYYYGSIYRYRPELYNRTQEIVGGMFKIWFVHLVTVILVTITIMFFYYVVPILLDYTIIINSPRPDITLYTLLVDRADTFRIIVYAGILYGVLFSILTRIFTISYTDSLVKVLVANTIIAMGVLLLSAPIIQNSPLKDIFYDGISDLMIGGLFAGNRTIPGVVPNLIGLICLAGTSSAFITEAVLTFNRKLSILTTGNYEVVHRDIIAHEIGRRAISHKHVVNLYCDIISKTINGNDSSPGEGLVEIKWYTFSGSEKIAQTIRMETYIFVISQAYNINIDILRRYYKWKLYIDYKESFKMGKRRKSLMSQLEETFNQKYNLDLNNLVSIEKQCDEDIEKRVQIIADEYIKNRINEHITTTIKTDSILGRRFLIVNGNNIIISTPVPYRPDSDLASNTAIHLDDYYRILEFSHFFDTRWSVL